MTYLRHSAVVDTAGNVEQRTGYYPSGTPYILPPDLDRADTTDEAPTMTPRLTAPITR